MEGSTVARSKWRAKRLYMLSTDSSWQCAASLLLPAPLFTTMSLISTQHSSLGQVRNSSKGTASEALPVELLYREFLLTLCEPWRDHNSYHPIPSFTIIICSTLFYENVLHSSEDRNADIWPWIISFFFLTNRFPWKGSRTHGPCWQPWGSP